MTERWGKLQSDWKSPATRWLALAVVALNVLETRDRIGLHGLGLPIFALAGLVGVLCINDGALPELGLRFAPYQGWYHWWKVGLWFGAAIALFIVLCGSIWFWNGWTIPVPRSEPSVMNLFWMCLWAPVGEEIVYRALLTVAVASSLGQRGTILVSGLLFGLVHILQGNPGPDNLIAGFLLQWAFLRSGTILVPIAMHSAGNFLAFLSHLAAWYWLPVAV